MNVVTITLSPAFDIHCQLPELIPSKEHLAVISSRDVGGKGINISRVLHANDIPSTALVVVGAENQKEFLESLSNEEISYRSFSAKGRIRENITLHTKDGKETRISFSSPVASQDDLWKQIEEALQATVTMDTVVTLTGRVPDGISIDSIKETFLDLNARSVKTVIDSKSFTLDDLIACRPWLIKPNEEELEQYMGKKASSACEAVEMAQALHAAGINNVMISLGAQGAVLVCNEGCYHAAPPSAEVKSTVGAGDSAIAGFLVGLWQGLTASKRLALSVAFGTAACMIDGTAAPKPEDISKIIQSINVINI